MSMRSLLLVVLMSAVALADFSCNEVHFWVEEGQLLNGNLAATPVHAVNTTFHNTMYNYTANDGIPAASCATGDLTFTLVNGNNYPSHHTGTPAGYTPVVEQNFTLTPSGTFQYIHLPSYRNNTVWNGYDHFDYTATCDSETCPQKRAFITVVFTSASTHNSPLPSWGEGYDTLANRSIGCDGTCTNSTHGMWYARHTLPRLWDMQEDENGDLVKHEVTWKDSTFATDALELKWTSNYAIIATYGAIGNMAARFPTMEEITFRPSDMFRKTGEQDQRVEDLSTGFDLACLDSQNNTGEGEDVWNTTSGAPGSYYNSGDSWYQKFGGKHDECDTFQTNPCKHAPLLTPRLDQNETAGGVWRVNISSCTVRWEGKFTWNAFRNQQLKNGNQAWHIASPNSGATGCCGGNHTISDGYVITGLMYNEAVQPNSWTEPYRGFAWINKKYEIKMVLRQDTDFQFELGIDTFTVDLQWFRYTDANNDSAFGYNMIVYPLTLNALQQSAPDRRILGYLWNTHYWSEPNAVCNGRCAHPLRDSSNPCFYDSTASGVTPTTYTQDDFPEGDCDSTTPSRVQLFKGPAATTCYDATDKMKNIQNTRGISDQDPCINTFQNITLRGTVNGSSAVPPEDGFGFEGVIVLQFLLANGEHPHFQINPKMYVESLCIRGAFSGSTATCRTSPFWPISDADDENNTLPTPYLCEEVDARTFGPTDWAVILFDIKDVDPNLVELTSLYVVFSRLQKNIYFYPNTSATGTGANGYQNVWWGNNFRYLHFRNLKDLDALNLTAPSTMTPPENMDFGFAFTPGAHNANMKITIYCTLRIKTSSSSASSRRFRTAQQGSAGENTLTSSIEINKNFNTAMRTGSSIDGIGLSSRSSSDSASTTANSQAKTSSNSGVTIGVLAAACGVLLVAVAGLVLYIVRGGSQNVPKRVNSNA